MNTATEIVQERIAREHDERSVHAYMRRFIERWTDGMNKHSAAEFQADLTLVLQAVHRDASRETHALLRNALAAIPISRIILPTKQE